jgi:aconitase A
MLAAGLLARNAVKRGSTSKPWVKTRPWRPVQKVVATLLRASKPANDDP